MRSSFRIASLVVAALALSTVLAVFVSKDGTEYCTGLKDKCIKCIVNCGSVDDPEYQPCVLRNCKGSKKHCTVYQDQSKNAIACVESLGGNVVRCQKEYPQCD